MPRKRKIRNTVEDRQLQAFMDDVFPKREPTIRIYRLEPNEKRKNSPFRKQTRLAEILFCEARRANIFEYLRLHFGPGSYLLRSVRSDGVYGASRVVEVG